MLKSDDYLPRAPANDDAIACREDAHAQSAESENSQSSESKKSENVKKSKGSDGNR